MRPYIVTLIPTSVQRQARCRQSANSCRLDDLPTLGQTLEPPRRATPTIPPGLFPPSGYGMTEQMLQRQSNPPPLAPEPANTAPVDENDTNPKPVVMQKKPEEPIRKEEPSTRGPAPVTPKPKESRINRPDDKRSEPPKATPKDVPAEPKLELKERKGTPKTELAKPFEAVGAAKDEPVSGKRPHPGKLRIATTPLTEKEIGPSTASSVSSKPDFITRTSRAPSLTTPSIGSRPGTPSVAAVSTGSPMRRTIQPRTIRITDTPKAETPPPLPASTSTATAPPVLSQSSATAAGASKQASRRPSITSTNQPGTPISERVDMFSVTSASASRASSPPPITTKKAKKDRASKQKRKEKEAEIAAIAAPKELTEEQAPILARKTKSKKNKPAASGPTPAPKVETPPPIKEDRAAEKEAAAAAAAEREREKAEEAAKQKEKKAAGKGKAKAASPAPTPTTPSKEDSKAKEPAADTKGSPKPITAAAILQALESTHQLALSTLSLLKPLTQQSELRKLGIDPFTSADLQNHIEQLRFELTKADEQLLKQGQAVRKDLSADGRVSGRAMVTPDRTRLNCLTKDEEEKYLDLEKSVKNTKGIGKWGGGTPLSGPKSKGWKKGVVGPAEDVMKALSLATETLEGALRDAQAQQAGGGRQSRTAGVSHSISVAEGLQQFNDWTSDAAEYVNRFIPPMLESTTTSGADPTSTAKKATETSTTTTSTGSSIPAPLMSVQHAGVVMRNGSSQPYNGPGTPPPPSSSTKDYLDIPEDMLPAVSASASPSSANTAARATVAAAATTAVSPTSALSTNAINTLAEAMATAGAMAGGKTPAEVLKEFEGGLNRHGNRASVSGSKEQGQGAVMLPATPVMSGKEAERQLGEARRETEMWEKRLNALIKKNKKAALGSGAH